MSRIDNSNNSKRTKYQYAEGVSYRKLPQNFSTDDDYLFNHERKREFPPSHIDIVKKVKINSYGAIFSMWNVNSISFPRGIKNVYETNILSRVLFLAKNHLFRKNQDKFVKGLWFLDDRSIGYFHWMTDALPRLLIANHLLNNITILLPENFYKISFVKDSLKIFKINADNLDIIKIGNTVSVDSLIIPWHTSHSSGNYNDRLLIDLRKYILKNYYKTVVTGIIKGDKKIFVSRHKAKKRKITNESDLIKIVNKYEIEVIHFEDLTWEEQVKLSFNTKLMISIHGAGLTNMLFMHPNSDIVEIRRKGDYHNNCYYSLASALSLKYYYIEGNFNGLQASNDFKLHDFSEDIAVDVSEFKTLIAKIVRNYDS